MKSYKSTAMLELLQSKVTDQSIKEFCLQNNLNEGKYYYWHKKLLVPEKQKTEGFISMKIKNTYSDNRPLAALEFPTGNRLVIYDSSMIAILENLL